jgi:hypothetical protein
MWPLDGDKRFIRWASLGIAVAIAGSTLVPAGYAAPLPNEHLVATTEPSGAKAPVLDASSPSRPPQAQPVSQSASTRTAVHNPTAEIANVAGTASANKTTGTQVAGHATTTGGPGGAVAFDSPNAYLPATLKITQVNPNPAIEGQPLQVSFSLTNNSSEFTLSGNVRESGNGQDLFGGGQGIDHLAPGATTSGLVSDAAPRATKGFGITLSLQGHFDDGTPAPQSVGGVTCGDCGGTQTTATASTAVDVAAVYYFELNSFSVSNTRARHLDTDYAVITAEQEPSASILDSSWGPQDVNNGDYNLPPLVAGPFYSLPDDNNEIVANYSIVNSGHSSRDDVINAMLQAGIQGAGAALGTFGSGSSQTNNAFGGAAGGNILGTLLNMFFANCDGVVVNDQIGPFTGGTLAAMTASGPHSEWKFYPGTDSPAGCGSNSQYWATWTLTRDNP